MIGGGTHQLKGIEFYRGRPVFYCLGNFVFENQYVRLLPSDYMEKYGLNIHTAASVGIAKRQSSPAILFTKSRKSTGVFCRILKSGTENVNRLSCFR